MNDSTTANRVFVYGTLMKGQHANHYLDEGTYLGRYVLRDYAMYNLGSYPGIVKMDGHSVIGEVYEIPDILWAQMDAYEAVDQGLYRRECVTVQQFSEKLMVQAYIYNRDVTKHPQMDKPWGGEKAEDTSLLGYESR